MNSKELFPFFVKIQKREVLMQLSVRQRIINYEKRGIEMDKNSQEFKNLIYDLANGSLDLERFPVAESKYVENEYEEGKLCSNLYSEMRDAYDRICVRLGKPDQEDRDVEIIINNLLDIGRHLSMKMYDYGRFFAAI